MKPLKPLKEYLFIEAWKYEDGGLGWSIKSADGSQVDVEAMNSILLEMAEHHSGLKDTLVTVYIDVDGQILTRRPKNMQVITRYDYVWYRQQLWRSLRLMTDRTDKPFFWMKWVWSLEFWLTNFKRSQTAHPAAQPPLAAAPQEQPFDLSERLEIQDEVGPKVVPFARVKRTDD